MALEDGYNPVNFHVVFCFFSTLLSLSDTAKGDIGDHDWQQNSAVVSLMNVITKSSNR